MQAAPEKIHREIDMEIKRLRWKIPSGLFQTVYDLPVWQKATIWLLSMGIPIALFWYFFLSAHLEEISRISKRIPEIRQELVGLKMKSRQLSLTKREVKAMQEILQDTIKLLPRKGDIPSVLTKISSLGNEARLDFLSFRPQKEQVKTFYAAIPVEIEFRGSFYNTFLFLYNISHISPIVHIKNLSMGNAKQSRGVWSQSKASTRVASDKTSSEEFQGDNNWIITTHCRAITYRFLSKKEQKAQKRKKKRR